MVRARCSSVGEVGGEVVDEPVAIVHVSDKLQEVVVLVLREPYVAELAGIGEVHHDGFFIMRGGNGCDGVAGLMAAGLCRFLTLTGVNSHRTRFFLARASALLSGVRPYVMDGINAELRLVYHLCAEILAFFALLHEGRDGLADVVDNFLV